MTTYVTFWCEYDLGINDLMFSSEEIARLHVAEALKDCGIEDTVEELCVDGLLSFEENEWRIISTPPGA